MCLILGIKSRKIRVLFILLFVGLVTYFLINIELIGKFALFVANNTSITSIKRRLLQVSNAILYHDYSGDALSGRLVEYAKSFNGILKHPILGNILLDDSFVESGHSTIMDAWACFGIVQIMTLAISLCYFYFGITYNEKRRNARNIAMTSLLFFVLVATFNPITASATLFMYFLIPAGYFSYINKPKKITSICETLTRTNLFLQTIDNYL